MNPEEVTQQEDLKTTETNNEQNANDDSIGGGGVSKPTDD